VYLASDFATPMDAGVSVFLYRVFVNHNNRSPASRPDVTGRHFRPMLPLDLYFLLTAWAKDASLQHTIAAWMMRVLEDYPSLPAGLLNHRGVDIFRPEETVELAAAELETETLFRIWEVIVNNAYQISVPYIARNVKVESAFWTDENGPVQERVFDGRWLVPA
jgi:Pvc16 N-terminal domain